MYQPAMSPSEIKLNCGRPADPVLSVEIRYSENGNYTVRPVTGLIWRWRLTDNEWEYMIGRVPGVERDEIFPVLVVWVARIANEYNIDLTTHNVYATLNNRFNDLFYNIDFEAK